jgi:hypothetical protein
MSVTIGGLSYNGATGTPYPVVPEGNLKAWATAAEAYRYRGSPRKDGGEIVAWLDCTQVNAQRRLAEAGGHIGKIVSVVYPHGTINNLIVASVSGEWQAKAGTTNGGVLVLRITFDYTNKKDSGDVEKSLVWCETSSALAGPWTQQPTWACLGSQDGIGTYAGDAEASVVNELPDLSLVGKYVRLVLKDNYPTTKSVQWVGAIATVGAHGRRDPSTGTKWGSKTTYQFAGIASVLAALYPTDWLGTQQGGEDFGGPSPAGGSTTQATCGFMDFNAGGGKDRGSSLVTVTPETVNQVYLHGTGVGPLGDKWNAGQALRTFLNITRNRLNNFPIKLDTSFDALLTYEETWSVEGQSVLDFIAQVLSPSVKRTFRLDTTTGESGVAGSGFVSIVPIDLEAAGSEVDVSTNSSTDWQASLDGTQTNDRWFLDLGPREFIATVTFDAASFEDGTKGWTGADRLTWDGRTGEGLVDSKILAVFRRFVMRRDWGLFTSGGSIDRIPNTRALDTGKETGELSGNQTAPDGTYGGLRILRTLPFGPGADFSGASDKPISPQTPTTGPLVWWFKGGTYTLAHEDYQVQVEQEMAGITLGRGGADSVAIKAKIDDSNTIRATLSFVHYLNWRASRLTAGTEPRTDAPRVGISRLRPAMRRTDIIQDTIVGLTNATTTVLAAAGRKDNGPDIADLADGFKRWFLTDSGTLQWTNPSVDVLTPLPGTIISQVKVVRTAGPPPVVGTLVLGGIPVAQRRVSWDLFAPGVTWTASRVMPTLSIGGKGAVVAQNGNIPRQASPGAKTGTTQPKPTRGL